MSKNEKQLIVLKIPKIIAFLYVLCMSIMLVISYTGGFYGVNMDYFINYTATAINTMLLAFIILGSWLQQRR